MILCFILTSCSDTCMFLETGVWSDSFHMARKGGRKQSRNILHMYCILGGKKSWYWQDFVLLPHILNCQKRGKVSSQFDILNVFTNRYLFDERVTHIISTCQSISGVTMKSPNPCILSCLALGRRKYENIPIFDGA